MIEAAAWGALAASSLLLGMVVAFYWRASPKALGLVLAFGAGALFSAISFELADEAIKFGSERILAVGMIVGSLVYIFGSRMLAGPRASDGESTDAKSIVLGAALDGIPESLAIGATVAAAAAGSEFSTTLLVAVALSNFPEALGATAAMVDAGKSRASIAVIWVTLVAASAMSAAIGYEVLANVDASVGAKLDAFTAGAVLAMVADTMMPDAYRTAGRMAGLATVVGFAAAFLIA